MNTELQVNQWGQIVAKAWQDENFKKRLLANPSVVLKEQGLETPAGLQIRIVENTDDVLHLTLPAKPREAELSDDDLEKVAGGKLATGLVQGLAKVFGWDNQQIGQILDADYRPPYVPTPTSLPPPTTDRSPPGPA